MIYKYEKVFKSYLGVIKDLEPDIFALKSILQLDDEAFHNLVIVITEGFNNAVKHGNKFDPTKQVQIGINVKEKSNNQISKEVTKVVNQEVNLKDYEIEIEIYDEGEGYEIDNVEDPRLPENILKSGGRGVFLIKELSKTVTYTKLDKINKLHIIFEIIN